MKIQEELNKMQIVFDWLYWSDKLTSQRKQVYTQLKNKTYTNLAEKYDLYSKASIDLLSGLGLGFEQLYEKAAKVKEDEKFLLKWLEQIKKEHPELNKSIEKNISNIQNSFKEESMFAKRFEYYNKLKEIIEPKIKKELRVTPEDEKQIKQSISDLYFIFNSIESKLTMKQRKILHDIEAKYLNDNTYYTDEHIDELLAFYETLPYPNVDVMLANLKRKKPNISNVSKDELNLKKALPLDTLKFFLNNVNYVQNLINKRIQFGEIGVSKESDLKNELSGLDDNVIETALKYIKSFEKLTGQKIIIK